MRNRAPDDACSDHGNLHKWGRVLIIHRGGYLARMALRMVLAMVFALLTSYALYRMEWFDAWRHGWPDPRNLSVYAAYAAIAAGLGWGLASLLAPKRQRRGA
jgi:hypothetical protein